MYRNQGHYHGRSQQYQDRPKVQDEHLGDRKEITIEQKKFTFQMCRNPRGEFMRIYEERAGVRSQIVIPTSGLPEFVRNLIECAASAGIDARNE